MSKLLRSNREARAACINILKTLLEKISRDEVEVEMMETEFITEGGAPPGADLMDYSHTGKVMLKIQYVDFEARKKHEIKTANWMGSTRRVMNR